MSQNIGIDLNFVNLSRLEADIMKSEENGGHFENCHGGQFRFMIMLKSIRACPKT